jgi:hypothetical protein
MESTTKTKTIKRAPFDAEKSTETPWIEMKKKNFPRTDELISVTERVARSNTSMRNYYFRELANHFKAEVKHHSVEEFFPYAIGGPMIFERPERDCMDFPSFIEKQKVLRKAGFRYAIVRPWAFKNMDDQMQDLAEQIEGKKDAELEQ